MTPTPMTPAAQGKALQILEGIRHQEEAQRLATCCALLAMLTSSAKADRESAKRRIRELATVGQQRQQLDADSHALAAFANRNEP